MAVAAVAQRRRMKTGWRSPVTAGSMVRTSGANWRKRATRRELTERPRRARFQSCRSGWARNDGDGMGREEWFMGGRSFPVGGGRRVQSCNREVGCGFFAKTCWLSDAA
jgi:hypothetical protein